MPVGFRIASAWVDIRAEDKGLKQQIKTAVEKAVKGNDAEIPLKINSKGLRREVQDALKAATDNQKPKVAIGIKSTGLRKEVTDALKRATDKQKPSVKLSINSAGLRTEVQKALTAATKDQKPTVRLGISSVGLRAEVQRALNEATAGQRGTVTIDADFDGDRLQRAIADTNPTISPNVNVRALRQSLLAAIRRINVNDEILINTNIDGDMLRNQINSEIGRLRDKFRVRITPDVDTDTFAARIRAAARKVSGGDIELDFNPRINQLKLRAEAAKAFRDLRGKIQFEGEFKSAMLAAQIKAAQARLNAMKHDLTFRSRLDLDTTAATAKLAAINMLVDRTGDHFSRLTKIAVASALLIPPALSVVDFGVRAVGSSLAVAVGYATTFSVALAAIAVGGNNVVNAITASSDNLKQYYDYLDQLTPQAQAFVEAIVNEKGAFKELQATVQETMFNNLAKTVKEMAKDTIPSFTVGLGGMALVLNGMMKSAFNTTSVLARMGDLDRMFGGMQLAMEPLVPLPGQILNALVKLSTASMPVIIRMNSAFAQWSDTMTGRLNRAFTDGTLQAGIQRASDNIVKFFRNIANNPEFTEFMDRVKDNGPAMADAFGNISEAIMKLVNALAPVNGIIVAVINAFAQFVNALPVEVLTLIITKLVLFKSALLIYGLIIKLSDAFLLLRGALVLLNNQAAMTALIAPRLAAMGASSRTIAATATAMRALGKAITGALLITTVAWGIESLANRAKGAAPDVDKLSDSLKTLAVSGEFSGELKKTFGDVEGFVDSLKALKKAQDEIAKAQDPIKSQSGMKNRTNPIGDWVWDQVDKLTKGKDSYAALLDDFKSMDQAFADMVNNGNQKFAAASMKVLQDAWVKSGRSLKDLKSEFPEYAAAVEAAKDAQKIAAQSMGVFGDKALEVSDRIKTLKADTDGLVKSLFELNGIQRDANQAVRDLATSAEAMVEATKKKNLNLQYVNGTLIQTTKAEREAAAAMETHAANTEKAALATYTATGSWDQSTKILNENKAAIIKQAQAAGMGATEAKAYADSILKIPSKKEITIMVADQATSQLGEVAAAYRAAPDQKTIKVSALNTAAIEALEDMGYRVKHLQDGSFEVSADTVPATTDLTALEKLKINPKTVEVLATITSLTTEIDKAQKKVDDLKQKQATALGADKKKLAAEVEKAQKKVDDLKQKRKTAIEALDKTKAGVDAAKRSLDSVKDKKVTITVATFVQNSVQDTADAIQKQAERFGKGSWTGGAIRRASGGSVPQGGFVSGPGGPKSDKVKALLSDGEYVIRASSVTKYGMSMMNAINTGRWPRFAAGGAVTGAGQASGAAGVAAGETTGTFTVKDGTGKPVASAVQNFKALRTALGQTYSDMAQKSNVFGAQFVAKSDQTFKTATAATTKFSRDQVSGLTGTSSKSQSVWTSWKSGMTGRTSDTFKNIQAQTAGFQKSQTSGTQRASTSTQGIWNSWKTGMVSRTNSTYKSLNSATGSFSKNSVTKIGQARDGMGSAWGGLSPRFKPPMSYLIHTVLNKGMVGSMNAMMSKLGGGKKIGGVSVPGFATGGPIYGAGSKTSDSIPARLSNGEFVIQARAVDKFGVGFFNQLNRGSMPGQGAGYKPGFATGGPVNIKIPGFASGGAVPSADVLNKLMGEGGDADVKRMTDFIMNNYVLPLIDSGPGGSAMKDVQRAGMAHIRGNVEKFVKDNFGGAGSAAAGLRWAKTQYGKPYQWGGNGNPSWDCSGFMSAIESVIRGDKPHRRWATGAFSGASAPSGWKLNAKAPFQIGITNAGVGHTAGTIGKENVESSGGIGVHGGVGVPRGANDGMFTARYGYVGPNATKKARGGYISGPGGPRDDKVAAWLSNGEFVMRAAAVKKLGTGYLSALNAGQIPGFAAGGKVTTTSAGTQYKIKYGDTLSEIAVRFNTTTKALMALNSSIKDANKIYANQTIWLKKTAVSANKPPTSHTANAPFALSKMYKVGKSGIESTEGLNALKGFVTLSKASQIGNSLGVYNYKNETVAGLSMADSVSDLMTNIWEITSKITAAFKGKAQTDMLARMDATTKALLPLQKNLDGVTGKLESAQKSLDDIKQKFDGLKESVSSAVLDFGKITKIGTYGTSGSTLLNKLQMDVTKSQNFAKQLEQLKAKGVNADLIGQIAEAGITGGGAATATTVLNMTPEELAKLNQLQGQLQSAADKAGTAAAEGMYGAGVDAAQGLVNGLKSQQKAIEAQMLKIAEAMEKAIKQALGIKSPSRVMMRVADFTADGLENQLQNRKLGISRTMESLVTVPTPSRAALPAVTGRMDQGSQGSSTYIENFHIHVDGTFDLTNTAQRRNLAKTIVKEMKEEIRQDDKRRK